MKRGLIHAIINIYKYNFKIFNSILRMIRAACHFHLHLSHEAAKSIAKLISQSCGKSQLAICLSMENGAIWRPPKHLWMSDRVEKGAWVKVECSTFSSIKYMCYWSIDVAIKWWWKVCLETVHQGWKWVMLADPLDPLTHRAIRMWPTYDPLVTHMLKFSF